MVWMVWRDTNNRLSGRPAFGPGDGGDLNASPFRRARRAVAHGDEATGAACLSGSYGGLGFGAPRMGRFPVVRDVAHAPDVPAVHAGAVPRSRQFALSQNSAPLLRGGQCSSFARPSTSAHCGSLAAR